MDSRISTKFKGLLTKRSSVDSLSTLKSYKEDDNTSKYKKRKSKAPVNPLVSFPASKEPENPEENIQIAYEHLSLLFMKFLFEPFSKISRGAVLLAYSVDPTIFYLLWSLLNYTAFLRYNSEMGYDTYIFQIFGYYLPSSFWFDSKCYKWTKSIYHLHILFSVRKLVLTALLFLFELQFLANYSTDLTTYLNELSCLRKFTFKWLNFVYYKKSLRNKELDDLMQKFLNIDMNVIKKSYNTVWMEHHKDDFKVFRPILSKWQHHNVKNDLVINDYNGTDFLKELWINSMSIKPSVNWIVLNYVIHNPPEILLLHHSIQLICKDTIDYCSKLLFDQIYETLNLLHRGNDKVVTIVKNVEEVSPQEVSEDFEEDQRDEFYQFDPGDKIHRLSQIVNVTHVDQLHITRDFEPTTARKYRVDSRNKMPELLKYRTNINSPDLPEQDYMNALTSNKEDSVTNEKEDEEDDRYITRPMCSDLDQFIVDDFFISYDISNCGSISFENFTSTLINMCSIRKKLITTLKNQRSILELVGNLISIILWFMSLVALLLSFKINKNIVVPSTIGLFSASVVALSYMYTSFITAIMFVVISNPYNVGDRVRIAGQSMYVRRITTYNTEFRSSYGQHIIYQNMLLSKMAIINESRAKHATVELSLQMSSSTTPASMKMLRDNIKTFVNGRPRDFVTNSIFFHCDKVQVSHFINLVIWATCVKTWSYTKDVYSLRTELMLFVASQCKLLGIGYENPVNPVYFKNTLSLTGVDSLTNHFADFHDKSKRGGKFIKFDRPRDDKGKGHDDDKPGSVEKTTSTANPFLSIPFMPAKPSAFTTLIRTTKSFDQTSNDDLPRSSDLDNSSNLIEPLDLNSDEVKRHPSNSEMLDKTLVTQRSTGPLSIEPTFPSLSRVRGGSGHPKAPPVPRGSVHFNKNAHLYNPHGHVAAKKGNFEDYEDFWINTWGNVAKPNRQKTFSYDSNTDKLLLQSSEDSNPQSIPMDNPEDFSDTKDNLLKFESPYLEPNQNPSKPRRSKRSSTVDPNLNRTKGRKSKTRSSSHVPKSRSSDDSTDKPKPSSDNSTDKPRLSSDESTDKPRRSKSRSKDMDDLGDNPRRNRSKKDTTKS
uniref:Mechanosensitive ion channel, putative n=1 Tax=Theileria annulata TaxID=5874 RepID=A0A3B0NJN7_THEAN